MAKVLTTNSILLCDKAVTNRHGGTIKPSSNAKLTVQTAPVITATDLTTVSACGNVAPPQGATPCSTVAATGTLAQKLTVGGKPVLLHPLKGSTVGVPPGALDSDANQDLFTAV